MAVDPRARKRVPDLVSIYRRKMRECGSSHLADKSHPALWISDELSEEFPLARFLGVRRQPLPTISSMLQHKGVLSWSKRWREFPVPNEFLGITKELEGVYEGLSLVKKCVLRWAAHQRRLDKLERHPRALVVNYEDLGLKETQNRIWGFLGLHQPDFYDRFRASSLTKWKTTLSKKQIKEARAALKAL